MVYYRGFGFGSQSLIRNSSIIIFPVSQISHILKVKKGQDRRLNAGCPWVYSNEIENISQLSSLANGELVRVQNGFGDVVGVGYYNRHSLISARLLAWGAEQNIDEAFFVRRISQALKLREEFFSVPYYRLVHSEADGIAGLIIDRFNNLFVLQVATFGIENLLDKIIAAINSVFAGAIIVLRNDVPARKLEGLEEYVKVVQGEIPSQNILIENNLKFNFDPLLGQKTGWFFDQRENRKFISSIAKGKDVLDCYCYNGGFGINAAAAGAKSVSFVDSSDAAINNVKENISLNNLSGNFEFFNDKVFDSLENLAVAGKKYQLVLLDPPAFIKSKKDFFAGIKGYEKLTKIAAKLVDKGGYLFIASCSHNAGLDDLVKASADGIRKAGRDSKIIRIFGADIDHPMHPFLAESEYLKSITYQLN